MSIYHGHEDRIQRIEDRHTEIQSELSSQTVKLDYLTQTLETGMQNVVVRLEAAVTPVAKKVDNISEMMAHHDKKLAALEVKEAERLERKGMAKKVVLWTVVAVAGAFLAKFGEMIWGKLF